MLAQPMLVRPLLVSMPRRLADAWSRYWFDGFGGYSLAASRIAVALSLFLAMHTYVLPDYHAYLALQDGGPFTPDGLLTLFPARPDAGFFAVCKVVALASTIFTLVGLCTRLSLIISALSNLILLDLVHGYVGGSSVAMNFVFLAMLCLCFADAGYSFSVDAWLRRRLGLAPRPAPSRWAVYLGQALLALIFFGACWNKLVSGGWEFRWVLSDNMRHWLSYRYYLWEETPTWFADWAMQRGWHYRLMAFMNVLSQLSPIGACLCTRRPLLRACFGGCFLLEVLGLGLVMGFWCLHWLPLLAFFIDWEALVRKVRSSSGSGVPAVTSVSWAGLNWKVLATSQIVLLLGGYGYCCFVNITKTFFPFACVTAFHTVAAKQPLNQHQTYEWLVGRLEIAGQEPPTARFTVWYNYNYRPLPLLPDLDHIQRSMTVIRRAYAIDQAACLWELGGMPRYWNWLPDERQRVNRGWESLSAWSSGHEKQVTNAGPALVLHKALYQIPRYPEPAQPRLLGSACVAGLDADGTFWGMTPTIHKIDGDTFRVKLNERGVPGRDLHLEALRMSDGTCIPLDHRLEGDDIILFEMHEREPHLLLIHVVNPSPGTSPRTFMGPQLRF